MTDLLNTLLDRRDLTQVQASELLRTLIAPGTPATRVAAALIALRSKGETHEELAGLAGAMREAALSPQLPAGPPSIDIVGTGGDGAQTLNISTAAALLLAAAGLEDGAEPRARRWRVIKHGNRAISSSCGSADVLAALGVPMPMTPLAAGEMLELTGFTFLFAPHYHGATAAVQSVRRELGVRTVFNLLGPLTNPGRPDALLIGAASPRAAQLMALAAHALGQRATVVHTPAPAGPCDEATTCAPFTVTLAGLDASQAGPLVREQDFDARPQFARGGEPSLASLRGQDAAFNAHAISAAFSGTPTPFAESVVLTAALALATLRSELDRDWPVAEVRNAISDGRARRLLDLIAALGPRLQSLCHAQQHTTETPR